MTVLDDELVPVAKQMLDDFGRDVVYVVDAGVFDPATSTVTDSKTDEAVKIVPPFPYERRFEDGDTIVEGDMLSYMAAQNSPVTPILGATIKDGSQHWKIVNVDPIYSGNSLALWKLQLRGGA